MDPTLFDTFELSGEWWLPNRPEHRIRGTVYFEPGKFIHLRFTELDSLGELEEGSRTYPDSFEHSVILGKTITQQYVALLDNYELMPPIGECRAKLMLISDQEISPKSANEAQFRGISLSFTYLEEWLWHFPFTYKFSIDQTQHRLDKFETQYKPPEPISIPLQSIASTIWFFFVPSWSHDLHKTFSFNQRASVRIEAGQVHSINWLLEKCQELQHFLTFLIGKPVRKKMVIADFDGDEQLANQVRVYFGVPLEEPSKRTDPDEMVLSFEQLSGDAVTAFDAWFRPSVTKVLEPLVNLFIGAYYGNYDAIPEFEFLALTQALESYHRRKYGGGYMDEQEYAPYYEALVKAIPQEIASDHKNSLKGRIKYGYEYALLKRLKLLVERFDEELQTSIGIARKNETYLQRITATRNYYTHYDPEDAEKAFKGLELLDANTRLAGLIVALILRDELQLPVEKVKSAIQRFRRSRGLF